eukprot:CAMPEP_0182424776 /NCGR_PEP_ID=MMETSP1167-20130531/11039_1 /TAXON_ID=2988 /ORGANISM="Mallomonas Sp, Strain CCMP3275" /LENGTH=1346 /DNA_ID=CAMNT_0024604855 /DNA_START=37 /DNA_END=4077 /DNA_ORIENTATION=+
MAKLVSMKVIIVGLKGIGIETAKNLVLAGPGSVILSDDELTQKVDLGANFFLSESDVGSPRAAACASRLQELNALVKVSVHTGDLTEDLVGSQDVVVMTTTNSIDMFRWNKFCRSRTISSYDLRGRKLTKPAPIRFIAVGSYGVMGYIFSDFGPEFTVADKSGEPPVQRVITSISQEESGVISLLDPSESELAKKADIEDTEHQGFVSFSEVEGMYSKEESGVKLWGHSINTSGVWRAKEVWKTIPDYLIVPKSKGGDGEKKATQYWVHVRDPATGEFKKDKEKPDGLEWKPVFDFECKDIPTSDFVLTEEGDRMQRMTNVKEHYKVKIGDTRNYSKYLGGGLLQQVYQPVQLSHRSLIDTLQQPTPLDSEPMPAVDGEKEALGWWYPMLHILNQALYQFQCLRNRAPITNNEKDAEEVIELAKRLNASYRIMREFGGESVAMATIDLSVPGKAPPSAKDLTTAQSEALESLTSMGTGQERALLALKESNWDVEAAMMMCFDEETMNRLERAVNVYKCLSAMKKLVLAAGAEFQPLAVFLGGVCAQEVVKHCGKFTPLNQWLLFDAIEVLPNSSLPATETAPQGTRYDHNIALFGKTIQQKLMNSKTFMVGCGALGCELLKNFALLGVACGESGLITVTDGDRIEVSNLNRQFLFRKQHVKKPKSVTAAAAATVMNKDLRVHALELLATPETEKVFCDDFWNGSGRASIEGKPFLRSGNGHGIDFTVNALDNVKARKYVDSQCVLHKKPLLESGTEGTKFNHMVILPGQTVSYDEGEADAPEGEAIPMCTLRNFPSTIIHCIEWARGQFEDLFVTPVADLQEFLKNPRQYITELRENAESFSLTANEIQLAIDKLCDAEGNGLLRSVSQARRVKDRGISACVEIAHTLFTQKFDHAMRDLQHQFPKDMIVNGKPFWAPPKRYPNVLSATDILSDEYISSFIVSVANLIAVAYGLHPLPVNGIDKDGNDYDTFVSLNSHWREPTMMTTFIPQNPTPWQPSTVKIDSGLEEKKGEEKGPETQSLQDMVRSLTSLLDQLESGGFDGLTAQPADFEKDLDLNFHIDFISAAANLRASNYDIPRTSRHKTKMIAGKIIAAIATSTACATALVSMELLKLVQQKSKCQFRDSSCSFAVNQFQLSEPKAAIVYSGYGERKIVPDALTQPELFDEMGKVKEDLVPVRRWRAYPDPHTKWDTLRLPPGLTLEGGIEFLKKTHGLRLSSWSVTVKDADGKSKGRQIYAEPAVDTSVDESLLLKTVSLEDSQQKAVSAIMRCAAMKNKQAYTTRWKLLKEMQGSEYRSKMQAPMRDLLESQLGSLQGLPEMVLEVSMEIAEELNVEAITPPVILPLT